VRRLWAALGSPQAALAMALMASVFWIVMLVGGRDHPWGDATPIYEVAESMVERHAVHIPTRWPPVIPLGRNDRIYAVSPLLPSLMQVPGATLRHLVLRWAATRPVAERAFIEDRSLALASHLGPAALAGLVCLLFFNLCRRMGVSPRMVLWGTAALGFGSIVAVYARVPYSEIAQIACFTGFFGRLLIARREPTLGAGVALGTWAGLLLDSKLVYAGSLAGAALLLAWEWRRQPRQLLPILGGSALGLFPWLAVMLLYNWARWGSAFAIGPRPSADFVSKAWIGVFGMFLSPGKSILLYAPPLLATVLALPALMRKHRDLLLAILLTVGPVVYVSGSMSFWSGDYAWGPRYLVFATPVLLLPGVLVFDEKLQAAGSWARRGLRALLGTLLATGIFVQVLGSAFHWDHWIRITYTASEKWLGKPDTRGSAFMTQGLGCSACFEQMYALDWLPPFQPIVGHWWLMKHVPWNHDWVRAEADAPWHTYTKLQLDISQVYPAGRTDWWMLDYLPGHRSAGLILLAVMTLLGLSSVLLLARLLREEARRRAGP
jgi:hypothetical protein